MGQAAAEEETNQKTTKIGLCFRAATDQPNKEATSPEVTSRLVLLFLIFPGVMPPGARPPGILQEVKPP